MIEVLVVIGMMAMILSVGAVVSINAYKGYVFRSEQSIALSVLERARSRAVSNYFGITHGVCYIAPHYIIFRGNTCTPNLTTNEIVPGNNSATITGLSSSTPIIFNQLTGDISAGPRTIVINETNRTSTTTINALGTIIW